MTKTAIVSGSLTPPVGPFSPAIRAGGFIYVSGQVGQDPKTGGLVAGGVELEAAQIFENLGAVLEAAGKTFADVIRVMVYLTDIGAFATMNAIYAKHFPEPYPARTTIAVAALPLKAAIEIDMVVLD